MPLVSLFLPSQQKTRIESATADNEAIIFEIDAVVTMGHERSASPTKSPIESGSNITDHITLDNNKLSIEGVITNNFFGITSTLSDLASLRSLQNPLNTIEKINSLKRQFGTIGKMLHNNTDRVENAFRYLEELHTNRTPFTIVTGLKKYSNMVLINLSVPQSATDGDSIRFSATFEQINIVDSANIQSAKEPVKKVGNDVKHTANKPTKTGKQQAQKAPEKAAKGASAAIKIGSVFGIWKRRY